MPRKSDTSFGFFTPEGIVQTPKNPDREMLLERQRQYTPGNHNWHYYQFLLENPDKHQHLCLTCRNVYPVNNKDCKVKKPHWFGYCPKCLAAHEKKVSFPERYGKTSVPKKKRGKK